MDGLMFPKPDKAEKKKQSRLPSSQKKIKQKSSKLAKLERERKPLTGGKCWVTGTPFGLEKHEIFGGKNRKASMEWGMVIELTREWHDEADRNAVFRLILQKWGQKQFERLHPGEDFVKIFGKNYLAIPMGGVIDVKLIEALKFSQHQEIASCEHWPCDGQHENEKVQTCVQDSCTFYARESAEESGADDQHGAGYIIETDGIGPGEFGVKLPGGGCGEGVQSGNGRAEGDADQADWSVYCGD